MKRIFKITPVFILFLLPNLFYGQVKTVKNFHDKKREICDSVNAETIHYLLYSDTLKKSGTIRITNMEGIIISEGEYENMNELLKNGKSTYYDSGKIKKIEYYKNGKLDGKLISYYQSGQQKREDNYKQGEFVSGKCFSSKGEDTSYFELQIMPQFPGGVSELNAFLVRNMRYPNAAAEKKISGRVLVSFVVEKDGSLSDIKAINEVHILLKEEAITVVKLMPKWSPGMQDGDPVRVKFTLPVNFKLN